MSSPTGHTQHEQLLLALQQALLSLKAEFIAGISEFEIITLLKQAPYEIFNEDALRDPLILFQSHFVLFHSLYLLQQQWRKQGVGELDIHALSIKLKPNQKTVQDQSQSNIQAHDALAAYYLDWQNLLQTGQSDVEDLLDSFWQKMGSEHTFAKLDAQDLQEAKLHLALPLEGDISLEQLKLQYRKLQHQHHPDKGGSIEASQTIQNAYTLLHQYLSRA